MNAQFREKGGYFPNNRCPLHTPFAKFPVHSLSLAIHVYFASLTTVHIWAYRLTSSVSFAHTSPLINTEAALQVTLSRCKTAVGRTYWQTNIHNTAFYERFSVFELLLTFGVCCKKETTCKTKVNGTLLIVESSSCIKLASI